MTDPEFTSSSDQLYLIQQLNTKYSFFSPSFSMLAVISKFENMTLDTCFRQVPLLLNGIKSSPFIYLTPGFSTSSLILTTSITLLRCPVEVFTNSNIDTRRKNQQIIPNTVNLQQSSVPVLVQESICTIRRAYSLEQDKPTLEQVHCKLVLWS